MSDIVVAKNTNYGINRNLRHIANMAKTEDISDGVSFVSFGVDTGVILGKAHKVSNVVSTEYSKAVSEGRIASPLILFCLNPTQANAMFENIKNDKTRFTKLAAEDQKEEIMKNLASQTTTLVDAMTMQPIESTLSESVSMEQSKRLALNNGVFKPNDNY